MSSDALLAIRTVLDEEPTLAGPATPRALAELVSAERERQDARLATLRRLRGDAAALVDDAVDRAKGGLRGALGSLLKKKTRAPTEDQMRARYQDAQLRARRAAVFAESLAGLQSELADEVSRLGVLLVTLARDEKTLDALLERIGVCGVDVDSRRDGEKDAVHQRELEVVRDRLGSKKDAVDALRQNLRDAEDRLLGLVEGERMLVERLSVLRTDVETAAKDAGKRLDAVADRLRALATGADAKKVVAELEDALSRLVGSIRTADDALGEPKR